MEHKTAKLFEPQASLRPDFHEPHCIPDQDDTAAARKRRRRRIGNTLRTPTTIAGGTGRRQQRRRLIWDGEWHKRNDDIGRDPFNDCSAKRLLIDSIKAAQAKCFTSSINTPHSWRIP